MNKKSEIVSFNETKSDVSTLLELNDDQLAQVVGGVEQEALVADTCAKLQSCGWNTTDCPNLTSCTWNF